MLVIDFTRFYTTGYLYLDISVKSIEEIFEMR